MTERDREIARKILEAEKQERRSRPEPPKRKWLKTTCPKCGYKIQYEPKEGWSGELRCPECGEEFRVSRLDDWAV